MRRWLAVFIVLWSIPVFAAEVEMRQYPLALTTANTALTLDIEAKMLLVDNSLNADDVYVNVSGTGIAAVGGATNMLVRAGWIWERKAGSGESFRHIGIIAASGTPNVIIQVSREQ